MRDKRVLAVVPKVKASLDPSFEERFPAEQPCKVIITTTDGGEVTAERAYPKGDPRDQLTMDELRRKFAVLADGVLSDAEQESLGDAVYNIESISHIAEVIKLTTKQRGTAA